jgi:cytochrome c553
MMYSTKRRFVSTVAMLVCTGVMATGAGAVDLERGEALFNLCTQCHGADASGNEEYLAPSIAGLSDWYIGAQLRLFQKGGRGLHFDDIAGMRMRPMALTLFGEEDVDSVAAYVASLPSVELERTLDGDAEKGQARYALCAGCHGMDASGNKDVMAPSLHTSDWYLFRQMQNYKAGVRGTSPVDTFGMAMRPMAMTLATDDDVKNVIAYIMSLSK